MHNDDLFDAGVAKLRLKHIEEANKGGIINRLKRPIAFMGVGLNQETVILGAVLVGTTYLATKFLKHFHSNADKSPESFAARREQEKLAEAGAAQGKA